MNAFVTSGTSQPFVLEKPNFNGGDLSVVIEAADDAEAAKIVASYTMLHPPTNK